MNESIAGYLAATFMGFVLGLLGGGGSILTLPILVYLCNTKPVLASSYSLWIVGVTALVGAVKHAQKQQVSYQVALAFGIPSLFGVTLARGVLLPSIPEQICQVGSIQLTRDLVILILFAVLMIVAGVAMILQKQVLTESSERELELKNLDRSKIAFLVAEGLMVGVLTGLVGAGGGFVIVPVLVLLLGVPMRIAIGTSLAIICGKSLAGLLADRMFWADANWHFLIRFTLASVVGILLGSLLVSKVSTRPLKVGFGWLALLFGFFMLSKELVF
ncbi:sulfite exporter TauE/SafE family protein [Adhaeretor mobilis]|uniref:Probable membrane transporter protein n=1 Tax=Adhaeretor mobilis TaxID=1930276 RepID=A0A517MWL7_9BACT|nr:sulfite exporter TauE/SafE family protein [Adhaeretor mobilis]QDS99272.1 Sulfite exporter TauE/SafE [Adhaeretor mobilis]